MPIVLPYDVGGASPSTCEVSCVFFLFVSAGGLRARSFLLVFLSLRSKGRILDALVRVPIILVFTVAWLSRPATNNTKLPKQT